MSYDHYHIEIDAKEGLMELVVTEQKDKHVVDDWWGDITGVPNKIMGKFNNVKGAVKFAVKTLKKKYKGEIVRGAGCPPDKLLEEIEKEIK